MSSHGGIIGVVLAVWWWCKRNGMLFSHVADLAAWACCIGLGLGRYANWINGELWGKPLPIALQVESPWWSVKYPHQLESFVAIPAQLEPLRAIAPATERMPDGRFIEWMIATNYDHASAAHDLVTQTIAPVLTAYYPSQFFQAIAEGPCPLLVMSLAWLAPRRAGTMCAIFFASYGVLRYATEQFREPDEGVAMLGGLTLPMVLSISMVAVGAAFFALSRKAQPIGGLVWKPR